MNKRATFTKLATVLVCTTFLYACSSTNTATQTTTTTQTEAAAQIKASIIGDKAIKTVIGELVTYDKEDYYSDWKNENANYIELSGATVNFKGLGAEVNGSIVTITSSGVYVISGKSEDGQIIIDVQDKGTVRLVLNGTEIKSSNNAPIYVKNAGKTIISLQEGTENSIIDGKKYVLTDASTDEPTAAIFSKDSLTINGTGKLTVHGNYNNGITSKDDLKITGGKIEIYSADDGLMGRDMVAVKDGIITVEAGGDAVKATNDTDSTQGIVAIEGGTFNLEAQADGMLAETAVLIADGSFNITSGGGNVNGTKKAGEDMKGQFGNKDNNTSTKAAETETETKSAKAIKASADIGIAGGTFNIDSSDDAIHSNNNVTIEGGDITIAAGDDGIHADANISIKDGKINITKSYEGIEGSVITISDGEIHVTASDDGINVAGGADSSSTNGRPGQNTLSSSGDNKLNIKGGYIVVDSNGDGLDANGSIAMTKGTVVVGGPTSDGNGALDYDGTFEMTGGFLVSAGSSGMAQAPSDTSTQYSIIMNYPQLQSAGTLVNLQDNEGKTIATFAPIKDYQAVVVSSPELKKGGAYTLYSGGTSTGSGTDGLYTDGKYQDGTKIVNFTISNPVTWLNESGVTTAKSSNPGGGGGGKGGFGGRQGGPRDQTLPDQVSPEQTNN